MERLGIGVERSTTTVTFSYRVWHILLSLLPVHGQRLYAETICRPPSSATTDMLVTDMFEAEFGPLRHMSGGGQ